MSMGFELRCAVNHNGQPCPGYPTPNLPKAEKPEISKLALEKAAQLWCLPETEMCVMDVRLATAFAKALDEIWSKPWLGNATTRELIEELAARSNLDYRTVDGD